ncbi:hypothetical protein ACJIZ3_008361 [Penstemon smallii]|uniref:Uncharacterized protein n=1 Tax=Penstemon smallii TaxID=265156 RepID=A0ABD3TA92_9LAMI
MKTCLPMTQTTLLRTLLNRAISLAYEDTKCMNHSR